MVIHCSWIIVHLVGSCCIFYWRPRSICCYAAFSPLKPPASTHKRTNAHTNTNTHTCLENNKRKAMCLVQLLKSCLVCVSWGGCTSATRPFIRPYSRALKAPAREMINTLYHLKRAWRKMDGWGKTDIKMEWLRGAVEGRAKWSKDTDVHTSAYHFFGC